MTYVIHGATGAQGAPVVTPKRPCPARGPWRQAYSSIVELTEAYRGADGVFVHLPVAAEEDRRVYAQHRHRRRHRRPARVVFSTSGFALDSQRSAVSILVDELADSGVSHAVIAPELSAQKLLGLTPRTTAQWLTHVDLH